ncbi:hypothetical protein GCM10008090_10200 [Arenicella chitinivorans]|uniref:Uncharacterized protein n=1 Tax=Arenicella chitinivorans TaxID=1329800 RepID=A0A918RP86_9GAMM|nr:hypothetical protein [Arenicella chitinivorans]GHA03183.1 hypothetical protein GCM10008090_10200 [Arenicella chitinivorans]
MIELVLVVNAVWFGLGFHLFAFRRMIFAKIIVPKEYRETPVFETLAATGPFLGGFNFAFCVLSVILLFNVSLFPELEQRIILFAVIAIAHGSQFVANLPIALENRKGKGVWQIKGLMRFIFITDFSLMLTNAVVVVIYAW